MLSIPTVLLSIALVLLAIDLVVSRAKLLRSSGWWIPTLIVVALLWPLVRS